jgi:hypothetical protein
MIHEICELIRIRLWLMEPDPHKNPDPEPPIVIIYLQKGNKIQIF